MLHYGLGVVIERYMYTFRPIRLDAKAKKKIFFYHHSTICLQHVNFLKGKKNILMLFVQNMGQSNPASAPALWEILLYL